jgi:hypothetical protein
MDNEPDWLFFSVTALVALVVFTATEPNATLDGLSVTAVTPVPESATVCGLPTALSLMVSVPAVAAPRTEGVKVSATVQLAPAATVGARQVDDGSMAYGVPEVTASDEMLRLVDWLFVRVTVLMALVWPTTTLPKFTAAAESVTGLIPVPLSAAVSGLPAALLLMDSNPAGSAPSAVGVSVIRMVQLELAASVPELGHVPPDTA